MEWIKSYFKTVEKTSLQEIYDKLFTSFWEQHKERVEKLYQELSNCLELKSFSFLFIHEGKKHRAEITQYMLETKPCIEISFAIAYQVDMYDDLDKYELINKMPMLSQVMASYGKVKTYYYDISRSLYNFKLILASTNSDKCLRVSLWCGDPEFL